MDIIQTISGAYDSLSRVQKRIATYVLQHTEDACFLSLKALAEKVNVSEVTIINFTHRIGLKSFLDFKHELQNIMRKRATPNDKLVHALSAYGSKSNYLEDCIENEKLLLERTFASLSPQRLSKALAMMEQASKIYVLGHDISLPVADFMVIRLRYLGLDAEPLNFGNVHHMTACISQGTANSLFILISFPVHSTEMQAVAALLQKHGFPVLAIVNDEDCGVAAYATHVLCCDTSDLLFYNSITSAISLVNLVCSEYVSQHQDQLMHARQRIQAVTDELAVALQEQTAQAIIPPAETFSAKTP